MAGEGTEVVDVMHAKEDAEITCCRKRRRSFPVSEGEESDEQESIIMDKVVIINSNSNKALPKRGEEEVKRSILYCVLIYFSPTYEKKMIERVLIKKAKITVSSMP